MSGTGGTGDVGLVVARGLLTLPFSRGDVTLRPGLGVGVFSATAIGQATAGYDASGGFAFAVSPSAGISASYSAQSWLEVTGSVAAGVSFPALVLRFPDSADCHFGQPYLLAAVGVALR